MNTQCTLNRTVRLVKNRIGAGRHRLAYGRRSQTGGDLLRPCPFLQDATVHFLTVSATRYKISPEEAVLSLPLEGDIQSPLDSYEENPVSPNDRDRVAQYGMVFDNKENPVGAGPPGCVTMPRSPHELNYERRLTNDEYRSKNKKRRLTRSTLRYSLFGVRYSTFRDL
jgi:hypothetical protein